LVATYGSVAMGTPSGLEVRLYGLGARVALSGEDQSQLEVLADELAATFGW
jgi:hypothetical protein